MKTAYDTIMKCRADGGKLAKEAFLREQQGNADLKEFLRVVNEPRINFYMKKIDGKFASTNVIRTQFTLQSIADIVRRVAGREVTGHDAKMYIANMYKGFEFDWEREMLTMLIERDAKAGFSTSTTNKVWPNLITDVPYMRCCLPKDAKLDEFPWAEGVISQIKADGMFANISHHAGERIVIESRNGSPFPLDAFAEMLPWLLDSIPSGYQTHGEFLIKRDGVVLPRQEGNGMFNTLLQGGELPRGCKPFYEAWDLIPLKEATAKNKYKVPYKQRFAMLLGNFVDGEHIGVIESREVHSLAEAYEHYRDALARGLEGTIVKHPEMIWQDGTSREQVKLKLEFEVDLRITGFNEGRNKYVGMLGSFQCESACGKLKVNVSGLTDAMRKEFWEDRDALNQRILTVKSNSIMPASRGEFASLFLPIFVELRLDKRDADTLERIQEQYEAAIASTAA